MAQRLPDDPPEVDRSAFVDLSTGFEIFLGSAFVSLIAVVWVAQPDDYAARLSDFLIEQPPERVAEFQVTSESWLGCSSGPRPRPQPGVHIDSATGPGTAKLRELLDDSRQELSDCAGGGTTDVWVRFDGHATVRSRHEAVGRCVSEIVGDWPIEEGTDAELRLIGERALDSEKAIRVDAYEPHYHKPIVGTQTSVVLSRTRWHDLFDTTR
ncbi:MAG TPA: hypothetical protein QGF58_07085 [Myxococcota bacterium]|nr:hypothetical protein [Myxococcota bacterium]